MKINKHWITFKRSFWFLPTFYGIVALLLSILTIITEKSVSTELISKYIPNVLLTDIKLGQTILSSIAISILTMTTITFSSIMVVLTTYSSQFSPRTLQDFISDVVTQRVLGIFTGGIIYSLLLLLFLKEISNKTLFVGPGVAVIWAIVCLAFFVYFIHHVATWTQVNNLIDKITSRTQQTIDKSFHFNDDKSMESDIPNEDVHNLDCSNMKSVLATTSGYLQMIDLPTLLKKASEEDFIIKIERRIGDYILRGTPLFSFVNREKITEDEQKRYEECFSIGTERTTVQDIEFGLQKLVEISLRAISPAINDPHTAINCINRIGTLLAELGTVSFPKSHQFDKNQQLRIIMDIQSYQELLYKSFYQIRHYGRQDVSVCASTLAVLHGIVEKNKDPSIQKTIWKFTIYFVEGIDESVLLVWDKNFINEKIKRLAKTLEKEHEYDQIKL
ncbi:DUF2254 domain-containing protein [Alkalihalobacillus sp. AL-G]|uniref:DUF2254 domain-containing protein n=1 Tax=Alkalihalobacillus sp. AL-G TaxID=2926399 RepID=UPI00272BB36B|nr:DUF2254 domain-containing protein [Alkalihalobacillus sp. AL-G]WLD94161.1 DUF2254 domain-containing protein [Alkalihalobacillus sp. AL-G]